LTEVEEPSAKKDLVEALLAAVDGPGVAERLRTGGEVWASEHARALGWAVGRTDCPWLTAWDSWHLSREVVVLRLSERTAEAGDDLLDLGLVGSVVLVESLEAAEHKQALDLLLGR